MNKSKKLLFKVKEHKYLIIILGISLLVYYRWISFSIFAYSDWLFFFNEKIKELLIPSVWVNFYNNFGSVSITLWKTPVYIIQGIFGTLGSNSNIPEKFLVFWPIIVFSVIKGKTQLKKIIGSKIGDTVTLKTKGLFADDHQNQTYLDVSHDDAHGLEIEVNFEIKEVNKREMAELNQDFFDKIFGKDVVKSEAELKEKIKEDAEKQFQQQADQQLLNAVTEHLVDNTKFDLPAEFLQKWLQTAGEKELTSEEATEEYAKSEKGLRYQLIEGKIMKDNDIKLEYAELLDYAKGFIKAQMAQFGNMNPEEKELNDIAGRVLSNQEEAQRLQSQLISQKVLNFYKENMKFKTKKVR